ncbi:hypothetical protein [Cellulosimicrobium marinum]|uniref:hypothetical protein n=1 Tax=Cellulosimicrobium marinum TaxID=1638992 RepID=UPI001E2EDBF3|nr:hypothetical protein [Cellulosimicrobium marinum]MCB7137908.1 hypothetical protein [Cellulosimicrobium marinum]
MSAAPVTGADVRDAVRWLVTHLDGRPAAALDGQAGPVRWTCWATAEHVVDDLVAYALQLAALPRLAYVPLVGPRGEDEIVHVDRSAGTAGLVEALVGGGELLATLVDTRPSEARAYHPYGFSDPAGFAAMGVVEVLVHGHDVLVGLDARDRAFPPGLAARTLDRLFPDVAAPAPGEDPDAVLLWATGRGELEGRPRRTRWRWDASVR